MTSEVNPSADGEAKWYILNYVSSASVSGSAQSVLDNFNKVYNAGLTIFSPTYVVREVRAGKVRMRQAKLMFHYVFVRGSLDRVKLLCSRHNGFSFLLNRSGSQRYATISEPEMRQLRNIARVYENALPFHSLDDIDLEEGDLVEVINGDFPGLIGTYIPKAKGRSGNIVLKVYGNIGTIAYDIKVSDIRVLSFAPDSTRANDQIDAIIPHLLKALRSHFSGSPVEPSLLSRITVFARRMEVVEIPNQKLEAKLRAILYAINSILGNDAPARRHLQRFLKIKHSVTNPHTLTLVNLLLAVADSHLPSLREAVGMLPAAQPRSAMQRLIADEATYYSEILKS